MDEIERNELELLKHASHFGMARHDMYADVTRQLLQSKDNARIFKILLAEASPEGKAHALVGLWLVDPVYYHRVKSRFAQSHNAIHVRYGCYTHTIPSKNVVEWLDSLPRAKSLRVNTAMLFGR